MFLFVFAEAKRSSGEISKSQYLMSVKLLHSASKRSQKSLMSVVFCLIYFAVLSLVLNLKQSLEAQPYPEKNS